MQEAAHGSVGHTLASNVYIGEIVFFDRFTYVWIGLSLLKISFVVSETWVINKVHLRLLATQYTYVT